MKGHKIINGPSEKNLPRCEHFFGLCTLHGLVYYDFGQGAFASILHQFLRKLRRMKSYGSKETSKWPSYVRNIDWTGDRQDYCVTYKLYLIFPWKLCFLVLKRDPIFWILNLKLVSPPTGCTQGVSGWVCKLWWSNPNKWSIKGLIRAKKYSKEWHSIC